MAVLVVCYRLRCGIFAQPTENADAVNGVNKVWECGANVKLKMKNVKFKEKNGRDASLPHRNLVGGWRTKISWEQKLAIDEETA